MRRRQKGKDKATADAPWVYTNSRGLGPSDVEAVMAFAHSFSADLCELRELLNGTVRPSGEWNDGTAPVGVWHVMRLGSGSEVVLSPAVWITMDGAGSTLVAIYC